MGKNTLFIGQPVFAQILKLINRAEVQKISRLEGYDRYVKKLDGYTHLVFWLFGVLKRYDSLRELVIGILAEARKLCHLGISYLARRSSLADANNRRSCEFFEKVYFRLYFRYKKDLSDSCRNYAWEKVLHIMDSTTITLFSDILKGAGRKPKHGKKKGGIKAHTVTKYCEAVPYLVRFTSAATHDSFMLKVLELPKGSYLAIDRAYIDYEEFEKMTKRGVYYVTKMKKNLTYKVLDSQYHINGNGMVVCHESIVEFSKDEIKHKARLVEWWDENGKCIRLITNKFDLPAGEIVEIYRRRWEIELLFKQLKQNFPLKYFYGDSVNAIKSQIWVTLIANLLLSVVKKRVKRVWSFSNLATTICHMLMHYIDLFEYLRNPEKTWLGLINAEKRQSGQLEIFPVQGLTVY